MFLAPLVLLLTAFFLGSLRAAESAQARVALQSRLDVCAVRLAVARERLLKQISRTNTALEVNIAAIYAGRAAMAIPGAGAGAAAAVQALLAVNASLAASQTGLLALAQAREVSAIRCAPDSYSVELAGCFANPPVASAFERNATLFPDVKGTLAFRDAGSGDLAKIRCASRGLVTTLAVARNGAGGDFHDVYRQ